MVSYFDFCYTQGFPLRDDCIPAYRTFSIGHGDTIIRTTGGFSISTGYDRVLPRERIAACFGYIATTYGCDVLHGLQLRRVLHAGGNTL